MNTLESVGRTVYKEHKRNLFKHGKNQTSFDRVK